MSVALGVMHLAALPAWVSRNMRIRAEDTYFKNDVRSSRAEFQ